MTEILYFARPRILTHSSTVVRLIRGYGKDGANDAIVLRETAMYPQGGGQPSDRGILRVSMECGKTAVFSVNDVRLGEGKEIFHIGEWQNELEEEEVNKAPVEVLIDEATRDEHTKLHSAGHLLDAAMDRAGYSSLIPTKGYHFPDNPFVEYRGTINADDRPGALESLQQEMDELVQKGGGVEIEECTTASRAAELCGGELPSYIDEASTSIRVVTMGGIGTPCGGTHVSDVSDLEGVHVTKITCKKGVTKVYYKL